MPGGEPGLLARLYPTGVRHYARIVGADDGQGIALAQFAHDRGAARIAIVYEDDDYGRAVAWPARRAARRLGMGVTGLHRIDPDGGEAGARALGRRISRARPDALLYAGVPFDGPLQSEPPGFVPMRRGAPAARRRRADPRP